MTHTLHPAQHDRFRAYRAAVMAVLLLSLGGCAPVAAVLDAAGGGQKEVKVDADYSQLQGRTVAIIVHADPETLYRFPDARLLVSRSLAARISDKVPGVVVTDPAQVEKFQRENPYWMKYKDLQDRLDVERLVVLDLIDYTLRDPENMHVWRGMLSANVGVVEREAANPESFTYTNTVTVRYPDQPLPLLESDEPTIQLGMLDRFGSRVASLFYDHREVHQR